MAVTVGEIQAFLDSRAPLATAEEWDNVGLLVGDLTAQVTTAVTCLDVTPEVAAFAGACGAQLIVSHHPVIFHPLRQLTADSVPYQLVAAGLSVLSFHTNLDAAAGGVNDTLAAALGLSGVKPLADGCCRSGVLSVPEAPAVFARRTAAALHTAVRLHTGDRPVSTVLVCGGAGSDLLLAAQTPADALVTGEVKHHEWLAAGAHGLTVVEAGHYATEIAVVDVLERWLKAAFPALTVRRFDGKPPYETISL